MKKLAHIFIALASLLALLTATGGHASALNQPAQSSAGLVIQFPDGSTQTYCIAFEGESISGLDMLLKTGLDVKVEAYGGIGAQVCKIGATGCDYPDQPCACQSFGPGGVYWSYHHLKDGQWRTSITGASSYRVRNGDVEGWAWSSGTAPALSTFSQLCPAAVPQPTNTTIPEPPTPTLPPSPTQPARPTATPVLPTKAIPTATSRRPTPTTVPEIPPTAPEPEVTPTELPATALPTSTDTPTTEPTATVTNTATSTAEPTAIPTKTPSPTATAPRPTGTSTATAATSTANREDAARTVGIVIGGLVLGSLAVWGITMALRRGRNGGSRDVE
ncbi:MAG: hypothetical protein ABI670_05170 [Chloroflexota bacterium]